MAQGGSLDRAMCRYSEFQDFVASMFLEPDMASPSANNHPSVPLQCFDNLFISQAGELVHTDTSMVSVSGSRDRSSSIGSR